MKTLMKPWMTIVQYPLRNVEIVLSWCIEVFWQECDENFIQNISRLACCVAQLFLIINDTSIIKRGLEILEIRKSNCLIKRAKDSREQRFHLSNYVALWILQQNHFGKSDRIRLSKLSMPLYVRVAVRRFVDVWPICKSNTCSLLRKGNTWVPERAAVLHELLYATSFGDQECRGQAEEGTSC